MGFARRIVCIITDRPQAIFMNGVEQRSGAHQADGADGRCKEASTSSHDAYFLEERGLMTMLRKRPSSTGFLSQEPTSAVS